MFDDGQDVMDEIFWNKKDRFQAVNKYVIADCWLPQVEDKCIHDGCVVYNICPRGPSSAGTWCQEDVFLLELPSHSTWG